MPEPPEGEIPVETARARMLGALRPLPSETVPLEAALGRTLAAPVRAVRDQPPFDAAAMDGYAIPRDAAGGAFGIVGESAAGKPFAGSPAPDEAVRIFTGARVPEGRRVVVQERARVQDGRVSFDSLVGGDNVRPRGLDFRAGETLLEAGARLDPWRLALAASAGRGEVEVARRPRVAILSTGEEIRPAGAMAGEGAIFDSGTPALLGIVAGCGGEGLAAGPVGDDQEAIAAAAAAPCDLLVTVGGASVGDHDLVKPALRRLGLELLVETVRLRPGKPTWFGRLADGRPVLGLPGNPASALVCAELFLRPIVRALQGGEPGPRLRRAPLARPLPANGAREHWMRGVFEPDGRVAELPDQDSSLVRAFALSDVLIRRPAGAPAAEVGEGAEILVLERG